MKKLLFLLCTVAVVYSCTSCNRTKVSSVYSWGLLEWSSSNFTDLGLVDGYFLEKGLKNGDNFIVEGKSEEENDKAAIAKYNNLLKNVSAAEISEMVATGTEFCFNLVKVTSSPNDTVSYVATYCYPSK